ncbi:unnamed protein product [Miscanthus lutarioriparius]|uniref:No apical meristem-associated C-terminal domain-containing protein n=1 Tax=Miscanthus lutarioriparius TaxID=422564 RepID=A0A811P4W7_9POAL|nr:unnamed protein product [Miscanthus lutarioriparius]
MSWGCSHARASRGLVAARGAANGGAGFLRRRAASPSGCCHETSFLRRSSSPICLDSPHCQPASSPRRPFSRRRQRQDAFSRQWRQRLTSPFPNGQPLLGPHALTFTEPHAATWDAGSTTTSPAHVYEVASDDFSPNHWTPDYSQPRASSAAGSGYFTNILTQEVDDDLELLRQQDATPSTGGKSKRGSNYTNLEDIQLCKSWIHISNDPIIGNQQPGKTYWERIANDFHRNRDFESDRTPNSLEHRFGIILKECMKFQGYYEEVERRHPSGIPYQEHLLEAQARYARKANGKNCQFEHCWLTLRHTQKFESTLEGNKKPAKSRELNLPVGSEQEDDESTAQGQESSSIPSAKKARPPGRKQSKDKLKKNEGDDEYKDMMQNLLVMKTEEHMMKKERWEKDMMLEQRRLQMEEERLHGSRNKKLCFVI